MSGALIAVFRSQRGFATIPDAPGIGTATATSDTAATVAYTAPANDGGATITSYVATSTPGSITGTLSTAGSGTITVSGLTTGTSYTFTVHAVNSVGNSAESSASGSITTWSVPDAPGISTATATSNTTATVAYTAPGDDGGATITSYVATSTPGSITGTLSTAGSGTITVNGLSAATAYTFTVHAVNSVGNSAESSASNSITTEANPGQQTWNTGTNTTWTCPAGVTSVSVLCIATPRNGELSYTSGPIYSFNGFGGALSYINNYSVTPTSTYAVYVSAAHNTYFVNESTCRAYDCCTRVGDGGGNAGTNQYLSGVFTRQGGSGAGGYSGNGGTGNSNTTGASGAGGGGGAGSGSGGRGGGGVGNQGEGSSGAGGASGYRGGGGSGGVGGGTDYNGGQYGGGGGTGNTDYAGASGSIGHLRIMWPGDARQYPSTRTADE